MALRIGAMRTPQADPWWVLVIVLSMALAGRAAHAGPRPSHPHLFFAADDIEALRKRVESGVPQQAWESIVARCESEVGPDSVGAALLQDVQDADRTLQGFCSDATRYTNPLIDLATAWALSGDRRFAARLETLLRAAQGLFPEGIDFWRQAFNNSVTTDVGEALATAYGLGFTALPSDLREWLRVALVTHCRAADEAMAEGNLGLGEA